MGSLALVTGPTVEPVSLSEAKAQCRVTHTLDDAQFAALIRSAREWAQGYTRRAFISQTWDYYLDEFPNCDITLPLSPVSSVTSIVYTDENGDSQTLSTDEYEVNTRTTQAKVRPVDSGSWPGTDSAYNAVRVRFVAGYSTGHPDVHAARMAMLLHIEAHYDRGDNFERLMGAAESLLNPLRVVGF